MYMLHSAEVIVKPGVEGMHVLCSNLYAMVLQMTVGGSTESEGRSSLGPPQQKQNIHKQLVSSLRSTVTNTQPE